MSHLLLPWFCCFVTHIVNKLFHTENPRYNNSVCYQRFCCIKIEFAIIKKLYMDLSKASVMDTFEHFFNKS